MTLNLRTSRLSVSVLQAAVPFFSLPSHIFIWAMHILECCCCFSPVFVRVRLFNVVAVVLLSSLTLSLMMVALLV